jgi:type II secretory pathway pseudopilin PulG
MPARNVRPALTLIEALVVIGIVGTLLALALPAIQHVRNSSYRLKCANHVKQLGLALHQFHMAAGFLPPGQTFNGPKGTYRYLGWQPRLLPYLSR